MTIPNAWPCTPPFIAPAARSDVTSVTRNAHCGNHPQESSTDSASFDTDISFIKYSGDLPPQIPAEVRAPRLDDLSPPAFRVTIQNHPVCHLPNFNRLWSVTQNQHFWSYKGYNRDQDLVPGQIRPSHLYLLRNARIRTLSSSSQACTSSRDGCLQSPDSGRLEYTEVVGRLTIT